MSLGALLASKDRDIEEGHSDLISIRIKANSAVDFEVSLRSNECVEELRRHVRAKLPDGEEKTIRLIFQGKMLEPPGALLSDFKLAHRSAVHAVATKKSTTSQSSNDSNRSTNNNSTGDIEGTEDEEADAPLLPTSGSHRGFDRLFALGMNVNDVAAVRTSFRSEVDAHARQVPREPGETGLLCRTSPLHLSLAAPQSPTRPPPQSRQTSPRPYPDLLATPR